MLNRHLSWLARPLGGACVAVAALLAACGGGGSAPGEPVTSFTEGQVTGYGSIVVNGVRFDDRQAVVLDEDDREGRRADVKIGMWVEIEGASVDRDRGLGRALRVRWANEFVGPVSRVDPTAATFVMFGQTIEVKDATQFEDFPGGLSAMKAGDVAEVHGYFNAATGRYVATRVEAEANPDVYQLRGIVSALDATARTFRLGTETIRYGGIDATLLPDHLADGLRVRVKLQTTPDSAGEWVAVSVKHGVRKPGGERLASEIEGAVTAWTSATQFEVNGVAVDASTAVFRDGPVGLGDPVEASGTVVDGVLKALLVKKDDHSGDADRNELHGTVQSVNTAAETFVLHHEVHGDLTVSYDHILGFEGGTVANLVPGAAVDVRGRLMIDGVLQASRVRFESGS